MNFNYTVFDDHFNIVVNVDFGIPPEDLTFDEIKTALEEQVGEELQVFYYCNHLENNRTYFQLEDKNLNDSIYNFILGKNSLTCSLNFYPISIDTDYLKYILDEEAIYFMAIDINTKTTGYYNNKLNKTELQYTIDVFKRNDWFTVQMEEDMMRGNFDFKLTNGNFLLHECVIQNLNPEIFKIFLKAKAQFNPININGNTPLMLAVKSGQIETVVKLIKCGADVNAKDYEMNTPLHVALITDQRFIFTVLLENPINRADFTIGDAEGMSVEDLAKDQLNSYYIERIEKQKQ